MTINEARQMVLTTWDAAGAKEATVERVSSVDETRIGFWVTDVEPWRARFSHSDVCSVQEADGGKPVLAEPVLEGRAEVLTEGPVFEQVRADIQARYGLSPKVDQLVDRARELLGGATQEGVVLISIVW